MGYYKDFYIWLDETGYMEIYDADGNGNDAEFERIEKLPEATLDKLHNEYHDTLGYTYEDGVAVPTENVADLLHTAVNTIGCFESDVDWKHFTFDLPPDNMFAGQKDDAGNVLITLSIGGESLRGNGVLVAESPTPFADGVLNWRQLSPSEKLCGKVAGIARDIKDGLYVFDDYIGWYLYELHIESTMYKETRVEYVRAENEREAMKIALGKYHCNISITVVDETF